MLAYIKPKPIRRVITEVQTAQEEEQDEGSKGSGKSSRRRTRVIMDQTHEYEIGKRKVVLDSCIVVDVDVNSNKVVRIEERWNSRKLLLIGKPSRYLNGKVSDLFTIIFKRFMK